MKTIKIIYSLIALFSILAFGCKEEFLLDSISYDPILVVDGMITNEERPYIIKVSESAPINNKFKIYPVEGCIVTIFDNTNNSEILTELEPGVYSTSLSGMQGEIGKSYRLSIITPNNREYNSNYQEIKDTIGIKSVYSELASIFEDGFPGGLPGYQFYVDTEKGSSPENYFLWKSTEAYEYTVDFNLFNIYFKNPAIDTNQWKLDSILHIYRYELYRCWKSQEVNYVFTGKTSNLNTPQIIGQPVQFVGTDSRRLQIRYSLNLKQYVVNKDAFYYWQKVEEQSTNDNFLISSQPYNIIGNIESIDNPNELIYGSFTAASVTQKRIFVNKHDGPFYYDFCSLITDDDDIAWILKKGTPPFYQIKYSNAHGFGLFVDEYCINCTLNEGDNLKPDFWIDN